MASHLDAESFGVTRYKKAMGMRAVLEPRRTLGECWVVYGLIRLVVAAAMFVWSAIATVMFGVLLNRVPDPFTLMGIFHFFYWGMVALVLLQGALGVFTGAALITGQRSARSLAIAAGVVALPDITLGIMLGGYTLVALLPARVVSSDMPNSAPWAAPSPSGAIR